MNKNARRKAKVIIIKTDSEEEENDSPSIAANCDSSRRKQIQSTEMKYKEGKAGYYLMFILQGAHTSGESGCLFVWKNIEES